ncbi:MAG TPA: hypothetical protein VNG31_02405 [Candidatus Baltobacteraceae bacterium]|nr:hypothetical protein [Candidatus Baltobacteraceae bacterium]
MLAYLSMQAALAQTPAPPVSPMPAPSASPTASPSAAPSTEPPPAIVRLSADHIAFYYDRFLIEADGNVRVQASDGLVATGDAFSMDLKLNRYLLAGHVTLTTKSGRVSGAAISDFLDFSRIYFVPVTSKPDRWTFLNGDLAHPVKGRVMPGDVFYFPTLTQSPSLTATSAVIGTKTYVRFIGATTYLAGAPVPLGSFVVNFSPNQYFAQNSLSGANFDATWNFAGNTNTLSALHLRYDTVNHAYLAFEQHLVGQHEYAIFSVNPFTKPAKFFNTQLYEKLGNRFQIQSFTQIYDYQGGFWQEPNAATQTTFLNATYAMPHSYLTATSNFTNYNILGIGPLIWQTLHPSSTPTGAGSLAHPVQFQLSSSSFQNRIGDLPIYEQIYGGYGFNHDTVGPYQYLQGCTPATCGIPLQAPNPVPGLQAFGSPCKVQPVGGFTYTCPVYTTIWNAVLGFNLSATSIKFGNQDNPYKTYFLNGTLNEQEQFNSLPHRIRSTTTNLSVSRQFSRAVNSYLSYSVQNIGDYYLHSGYAPCNPNPPSSSCPSSLAAFRGVATLRTLSLAVNYVPHPEFNLSLLYRHHDDFPIPVPGLFALPLTNVLGQPIANSYLGQPPNDVTADVRFQVLPHMALDVSRTYYFYGNPYRAQFWAPNFIVQVLPY